MLNGIIAEKNLGYDQLVHHLLYTDKRLDNTAYYLAENYGAKAVPALVKALPLKSDYESTIILNILGKLGDIRAIIPICTYISNNHRINTAERFSANELTGVAQKALVDLIYYSPQRKKAIKLLVDIARLHPECLDSVVHVLRQQKDEYVLKLVYQKLFKQDGQKFKQAALKIVGLEDGIIDCRLRYLKKMTSKLDAGDVKVQAQAAYKVLTMKRKCQNLCKLKGMEYGACYLRDDNQSFECCCVEKSGKRVMMKFKGSGFVLN